MALVRILPNEQVEWILERKPLLSNLSARKKEDEQISLQGLLDNAYIGLSHNIFNYYNGNTTTSFIDMFNKLVFTNSDLEKNLTQRRPSPYRNTTKQALSYISYDELDSKSLELLENNGNDIYPLDFSLIASNLTKNYGLSFDFESDLGSDLSGNQILGAMDIKRNIIKITNKLEYNSHSWRFTLGHEISHYILHSGYILNLYDGEYNEIENNLSWNKEDINKKNIFNQFEWQANTFANSMLMPKCKLYPLIVKLVKEHNITNFNNGVIYLDDQPCNRHYYQCIITKLKTEFNVSASIATIRLKQLRILNDARTTQSIKSLFLKND